MLGILLLREHDPRPALLLLEVRYDWFDRLLEDVVGEHHEHPVAGRKALR